MSTIPVVLAQMGESVTEGTITKWLKQVGDRVEREELLYEISTDKVDTEIPSPAAGVLEEILVQAGSVAKVGAVVAKIGAGAAHKECPPAAMKLPVATTLEAAPLKIESAAKESLIESAKSSVATGSALPRERVLASPLARHAAKEAGVDLTRIEGSGIGGRIVRSDIDNFMKNENNANSTRGVEISASVTPTTASPFKPAPFASPREERVPMTTMRKKIAEHMVMSKRVSPHVTSVVEVNVQKIVDARKRFAAEFERTHGFKLSYTPFLLTAAIAGLRTVPILNSTIDNDDIVYKKDINLGVAVALETGLIVPVLKQAQDLSFVGIARALNDLAERARTKKLSPDDVKTGTFSVTNYGVFGTLIGQPIINQPQVGIMGVGTFEKRPVVIDDAIAIRTMCYIVCSYDHRVVDGADGGRFLAAVKASLENWNTNIL